MKRKGKQSELGPTLGALVRRLDRAGGGGYRQSRVGRAWGTIAGEAVLAHTFGAHLRDGGELVVLVDSPIWAAELSSLSEHYRQAVNEEIGENLVRSVRFTVSKKVAQERALDKALADSEESIAVDRCESVELTPQELAQVEASAASIPDAELRRAVLRATVADLEWKKGLRVREKR